MRGFELVVWLVVLVLALCFCAIWKTPVQLIIAYVLLLTAVANIGRVMVGARIGIRL
jgi:hypothetical protein